MIRLSSDAERQLDELLDHYARIERPEAGRKLIAAIDEAVDRIERNPDVGIAAPRPYPELAREGWLWTKAGRYWIVYSVTNPPMIIGVFYETSNIRNRF